MICNCKTLAFACLSVAACLLSGCKKEVPPSLLNTDNSDELDLTEIEESGELIAVTINGPETYYVFHGREMGLQYILAENFANSLGLRLRMETARDTLEMIKMLKESKADLLACKLPQKILQQNGLQPCGVNDSTGAWSVKKTSVELTDALNEWYSDGLDKKAEKEMKAIASNRYIRRTNHVAFFSKSKGVVSSYDMLFLKASKICGWDWKLIASQCYQESGFDAEAVSWAGAKGLMQIMPSTAAAMGVEVAELFNPEINVLTAARYIKQLERRFSEVTNANERKKFVLASYNGGYAHVSDAMKLARKYGRNPHSWNDVAYFVLHLSEPRFYRDPVVKSGYMIGGETYNYVNSIMERWGGYHAVLHNAMPIGQSADVADNYQRKKNRFSTKHNLVGRDDSMFIIKR